MLPLIVTKKLEISSACRDCGVARLDVFGSAATGRFDEDTSDIDFLVSFTDASKGKAFDYFFELKERLEEILDHPVDLVTEPSLRNDVLRTEILRNRRLIYASLGRL